MSTPRKPFSTILALAMMKIINSHDHEVAAIMDRADAGEITEKEAKRLLTVEQSTTADLILETCQKTIAPLEATVDKILEINDQMRVIRT